ncbi:MAG: YlmC/YmxH family sporulation protein [Ruminococcus sp.]|nr:YlmC/YmxH family sporulation protein [Ruminococcus sp.]
MLCGIDDLRCKEVIDIATGERLGNIDDAEINLETAEVVSIVIYGRLRLFGLLGREEDIVLECGDIKVVGSDVVLVKRPERRFLSKDTNIGKISLKSLLK